MWRRAPFLHHRTFVCFRVFGVRLLLRSTGSRASPTMTSPLGNDEISAKAKEIFTKLDVNNDGNLTYEELRSGLRALKIPSRESHIESVFVAMDKNKDRAITLQEFSEYVASQRKHLEQIFKQWDLNGDGQLDAEEVRASLESLGLSFNDDEVNRLVRRFDKNQNGQISFEEWQELLLLVPFTNTIATFRYWEDALALETGDVDSVRLVSKAPTGLKDTFGFLIAGAVAGTLSRTGTAPLDRVKVLFQINTGPRISLLQLTKNIYAESGLLGFWRGNGANVLKVAPESAVKFFTFEFVKRLFADNDADVTTHQRMIAGASAGVACHSSLFPLEVIKTRLQAAPVGTYTGIMDAVIQTFRHEGIRGFYRGLSASLMSTIPHASVDLTVYETLKSWVLKNRHADDSPPGHLELLACATGASTCGQLLAFPFHLVKTRYIAQGMGGKARIYTGLIDVFVKTFRSDGFLGFYRGIIPNFAKSIPSHGITFVSYEYMKRQFGIDKHKKQGKH